MPTAGGQVARHGRRHGRGEPQIRQHGGEPRGRGGLGVELLCGERLVRNLQHPQRAAEVVFEQEVGVLLAAQRAPGHRASQHVPPDRACLGLGQLRGRQLARGEEVEASVRSAHRCRPPSCVHSGCRITPPSRSAVARPRRENCDPQAASDVGLSPLPRLRGGSTRPRADRAVRRGPARSDRCRPGYPARPPTTSAATVAWSAGLPSPNTTASCSAV